MTVDKYHRTYHLPFSKGLTNDDRKAGKDWWEHLKGKELVLTEKLDGSNSALTKEGPYSRSCADFTKNPWDVNLWNKHKAIGSKLGDNEIVYGESMYAIHSITYDKLPNDFFIFACKDMDLGTWYSWSDVELMADMLKLPTVPIIARRVFNSPLDLEVTINQAMTKPSAFGDTKEGVVVRLADSFSDEDFNKYVLKFVRANHVQTDEHWSRNWKKATINY